MTLLRFHNREFFLKELSRFFKQHFESERIAGDPLAKTPTEIIFKDGNFHNLAIAFTVPDGPVRLMGCEASFQVGIRYIIRGFDGEPTLERLMRPPLEMATNMRIYYDLE